LLKARSKKLAILLTLAMLATMVFAVPAIAGDPVKVGNGYTVVSAGTDNQAAGYFTIFKGDYYPVDATSLLATQKNVLYVTIELDSTQAKWTTAPVASNMTASNTTAPFTAPAISGTADTSSVTYVIDATGTTGQVQNLLFQSPNIDVKNGVTGDICATVTIQNLVETTGGATTISWTQTATPVIATVGTTSFDVSAGTTSKYGSAPKTGVSGADIKVKESKPGAFAVGDVVTLTLNETGATFSAAPTVSGTAGLTFAAGVPVGSKSYTFTVTAVSSGIAGTATFKLTNCLDFSPATSDGDITVDVTCTNSSFEDATVTVANIGSQEFTVTSKSLTGKKGVPGQNNVNIGDLEIDPSSTFASSGALQVTVLNGEFFAGPAATDISPAAAGWSAGSLYNDNKSLWYTAPAAASSTTITLSLPNVNLDADAPVGDILVELSGTAGVTGQYKVGVIESAINVAAEKATVNANCLNQPAGNITITEAIKDGVQNFGNLSLVLPNGIVFSKNPTVYVNGEKVTYTPAGASGKNYGRVDIPAASLAAKLNNGKIDTIEIKDIEYDVDSRFVSEDITVEIQGLAVTKNGTANKTVASVVNAIGQSPNSGSGAFVIGSTTYVKNGAEYTMDVAPYIKNDRTYMPVRYVAYVLGIDDANILWDGVNQTVTLMKGDKVVQLTIGSKALLINGATITMDVAPEITSDRTMLPLRFVAQAFGATVSWDEATQTASLEY